jgi:hypothetical protein
LLLSVDRSYRSDEPEKDREAARKIFKKHKVDWPNVFVPTGWNDIQRTFNAGGYGKILVDPKGVVLGVNLHSREVEALLEKVYPKH